MKKKILTKLLAVLGTIFVWLPVLAPVVFGFFSLAGSGKFHLDYLMPFELFPVVFAGFVLLVIAAKVAKRRLKGILWGIGVVFFMIVASQGIAMASGLASGRIEPQGIWWGIVLGGIWLGIVAIAFVGVIGILLIKDLYMKHDQQPPVEP